MSIFLNPPPTPRIRYTKTPRVHYPMHYSSTFLRLPGTSLMRLVEVTVDYLNRPPNVFPPVNSATEEEAFW